VADPHPTAHLLTALLLVAGALVFNTLVTNRAIKRRLFVSMLMTIGGALVHVAATQWPERWLFREHGWRIEWLLYAIGAANGVIALLFNRWRTREDDYHTPAIVQDFLLAGVGVWAAAVLFQFDSASVFTGSALVAAILGFAAQGTLGNAFAGIALQMERPFRVGHTITVGEWSGIVTEVTWRATKIRTRAGNMVTVPNSEMASQSITNFSEPVAPSRLEVHVGLEYDTPPNEAREALLAAVRSAPYVLTSPPPDVLFVDFANSALIYRVRFWVKDYFYDDEAYDAVRTRMYYELRRRRLNIPYPIQVEYGREEQPPDVEAMRERYVRAIAAVPVFARLTPDAHKALAASARELLFADAEVIVAQDAAGGSMFVVAAGQVAITIGPERREVALTRAGGYFGEMSLLTGEPRTATVLSRGDSRVIEISGESFRDYVQTHPEVIDELAHAAAARRKELDDARAAAGPPVAEVRASLREKMRAFFGLN
jgi:small-conductance mechanosensitive channel